MLVTRWRRPPGDHALRRHRFDDHWTHVPLSYASLRRGDFDLAHALFPTDGVAAARWARRAGRPTLFSMMGVPNPLIKVRFDALPRAARGASAFTVDSRAVADAMFWRYGLRGEVVYPGVDLDAFTPGGPRAGAPTILCPAPLGVARKRVRWLVEALPRVRRERPDARLLLLRPPDASQAAELERAGVELFDSRPAPEQLAPLYREAWVTALPSWGEAFGMVLTESLACGTPVVGTDRDAFGEIVEEPSVGRLFDDERGAEALAEALLEALELAEDPGTQTACRRRAADFGTDRMVAAFAAIYARLLA
ncbi:MAG: glycosyl transferase group 1 [Solirubrobacteraceae bacterium]|nr:glycosyl transferase group 1 [Solirubrobacteraceae bacterium]